MTSSQTDNGSSEIRIKGFGIRLALALVAALAAYFLTVQELRTELSGKAEEPRVQELETKLTRLEANEREYRMTAEEFREFRNEVIARLTRIESLLDNSGGKRR